MKTVGKNVTVFDVYDRAKTGPKMEEKKWDYEVIPSTARELKKKYNIKMDKSVIVPEDIVPGRTLRVERKLCYG